MTCHGTDGTDGTDFSYYRLTRARQRRRARPRMRTHEAVIRKTRLIGAIGAIPALASGCTPESRMR